MKNIKICVVGAGKWGTNHIQTLLDLGVNVGVVENNFKQKTNIEKLFPNAVFFNALEEAFQDDFQGYIIATPPITHLEIAKKILSINKAVLVEKPLTISIEEGNDLLSLVEDKDGKLVVGHLLLFHPAILKMKEMIDDDIIGNIQYLYSNRLNLGVVRKEENVFWSFAPHDIALFQFFSNSFPHEIVTSGGAFLQKEIYDTTITYLKYPNGIQGHIYVNWLHPFREKRLVIIGSKGALHFEDISKPNSLLLYEKEDQDESGLLIKNKSPKKIKYSSELPLVNELKYFIDIVKGKPITKANIQEGLDVIKILEMATNSLNQ